MSLYQGSVFTFHHVTVVIVINAAFGQNIFGSVRIGLRLGSVGAPGAADAAPWVAGRSTTASVGLVVSLAHADNKPMSNTLITFLMPYSF